MHFGESQVTGHVRPRFMRRVVAWLQKQGASPFLTDTNTLYRGARADTVSHLRAAAEHGFTFQALGAPVVIAGGLRGTTETVVPVEGRFVTNAGIGPEFVKADALLSVAHFKGHEVTGFGGTLKNLGMGCASRAGKLDMHSTTKPYVKPSCTACGVCVLWCPADAITVAEMAAIDGSKCIGCAECIAVCPTKAVGIRWNESTDTCQMKMVEYAGAVVATKRGRVGYINFITDVHPVCDCFGTEKIPIVPDVGVLASLDPVAIDQAAYDLVNEAPAAANGGLSDGYCAGSDKFRDLHPDVDPTVQLRHAEELGLGTRDYELIEVV
ncbi:MAG: DUF362 domain-containing protein [Candidatus Eisenbacteria bacterium]|nr:DUF362 domain-containing protein [Candidatus Eisenbacteria bacterium]